MNNTAYVPPGPLSVFSAAVSSAGLTVTPLQEAIMSRMRPFGLTAGDLKDLPPSPFLPGGLGLVRPDGFPAFQLQPPFLHPALESRLPALTASAAFRPMFSMAGETPILKSFPSAFQPPGSKAPPALFSPGHNLFPRMSPTSSRSSPSPGHQGKADENSNTDQTGLQLSSPEGRDLGEDEDERSPKRLRLAGLYGCPICGLGLTPGELEGHYTQEVDYLGKLSLGLGLAEPRGGDPAPRTRWDSFQRIQRNRQSRIRVKMCRKAGKRADEVLEEDLAAATAEEDIDIVGVEKKEALEEKKKLVKVVKTNGAGLYGPQQFTDEDVLTVANQLEEKEQKEEAEGREKTENISADDIKKEEDGGAVKKWCSQCQGSLEDAVVSLHCWHVQCRLCWLRCLARKQGCSACGGRSAARDLRRVFL